MADLRDPRLIHLKGWLFLIGGLLAVILIIIETFNWKVALLLALSIWCFCRFYYYCFYVIENYVDSTFKFSGIWSVLRYLISKKNNPSKENSDN